MLPGNPGSPPPSQWAEGNNALGPQAGYQSKASWTAAESDSRPLCSGMRLPVGLWRLTVLGKNVSVDISYGTSSNKRITGLRTPIRVTLPGSCDVYAQPIPHESGQPSEAEVTLVQVTSGCCDSECRKVVDGFYNFEPDAVRFVALIPSVVRVGPGDSFITVNLDVLQEVSLIAGSALTSGGGFLEFEP